ncbi:MAG: DUF938 domain-containing protein [Albidovulum sp.]|uniref:DUF938 domain-containing protein n=1 Tax=Albidovulum sp. TaxID=1872424 RepID=UPI003C9FB8A6
MSNLEFGKDEPKQPSPGNSREISAPAALRNREVIADVLGGFLPEQGNVLELASGTGEHVCLFAERFDRLTWQATDMDPSRLESIAARASKASLPNLLPPRYLNVTETDWHAMSANVIVAINLFHVAPKAVSGAVLSGAAQVLGPGGVLCIYGPFTLNGVFNTDSNREFNDYLREQNPEWGLRDIADIDAIAEGLDMVRTALQDMPANNFLVVYQLPE